MNMPIWPWKAVNASVGRLAGAGLRRRPRPAAPAGPSPCGRRGGAGGEPLGEHDRTSPGPPPCGVESLVQIDVHSVDAEVANRTLPDDGVEIGAEWKVKMTLPHGSPRRSPAATSGSKMPRRCWGWSASRRRPVRRRRASHVHRRPRPCGNRPAPGSGYLRNRSTALAGLVPWSSPETRRACRGPRACSAALIAIMPAGCRGRPP